MENTALLKEVPNHSLLEKLTQTSTSTNNVIDYTKGHFIMEFIHEDVKVYASVNEIFYSEFCGDNGLAPTGGYFVYLIHPTKGSLHFTLEFDEEKDQWDIESSSDTTTKELVGKDVIKAISDKIESCKM